MMNYGHKMDYLKEHFVKEKGNYNTSPSLLFLLISFMQCLTKAKHMVALKLLTDKREIMLFFPFKVFPNSEMYNIVMSTSTFLVIKKSKKGLKIFIYIH